MDTWSCKWDDGYYSLIVESLSPALFLLLRRSDLVVDVFSSSILPEDDALGWAHQFLTLTAHTTCIATTRALHELNTCITWLHVQYKHSMFYFSMKNWTKHQYKEILSLFSKRRFGSHKLISAQIHDINVVQAKRNHNQLSSYKPYLEVSPTLMMEMTSTIHW